MFPLSENSLKYMQKAKKVIIIENNAKGHFAQLIQLEMAYKINEKILKYNGRCFSVEEVTKAIDKLIERGGDNG